MFEENPYHVIDVEGHMAVDEFFIHWGLYLENYFEFRPHKRNTVPPK